MLATMRAAIFDSFQGPISVREVPDPVPREDGVVVRVKATGVCRSDWHGWMGHDPDIRLPHVPGHELAGVIEEVGRRVTKWKAGDRVTVPFSVGCGECQSCSEGNSHICDQQFQPGFNAWGTFAELVALRHADFNLVAIPESLDFVSAVGLGCRFATAWRAVAMQGALKPGQWLAVHGCGGVGLSAIMIAKALAGRVIAIDLDPAKLRLAVSVGAEKFLTGNREDLSQAVHLLSGGGAHVSIDANGSAETCRNSILSLRKRGRHVQVGLLPGDESQNAVPMEQVIARELEIVGSHGLAANSYGEILRLLSSRKIDPSRLIGDRITLRDVNDVINGIRASGVVANRSIWRFRRLRLSE